MTVYITDLFSEQQHFQYEH